LLETDDPHEWLGACEARAEALGPQVLPVGWGLEAPGTRVRLKRPELDS
jgi:hypothetical protein